MSLITEVRKEREDLARVLKKHTGIRKIVEDLYPDSAHFIYELLQNAEDTGATETSFILSKDNLVFEHNGRSFSREDIESITDIGEGTKTGDNDKIGRFGVGFKAVFAYSETPLIWSPTHSFKISDLVLPSDIATPTDLGKKTRFKFPFNNPKKSPGDAYDEVEYGLNELAETTLLFLSNIESIQWSIDHKTSAEVLRIQHSENHFEVLKQVNKKKTYSAHFLKFDQSVSELENQKVSVAYALDLLPKVQSFNPNTPLSKQLKIVPANPGNVAVFFPAEKETSGLRFHLHAPFIPELSRASIKETPANSPLFQQLAALVADSLRDIRDLELLTVDFLGVLPNLQDTIPERYACIRSAIVGAMNTQPLTPTHSKSHQPAECLLQAKASLKDLLSNDDIEFLVDDYDEKPQWAIGARQKNSNVDRFLSSLKISEWNISKFVKLLTEKANIWRKMDDEFMVWIADKSVKWHQQLYALLYDELDGAVYQLRDIKIIRLVDGDYSTGGKCFFPGDAFENDKILPRIDGGIFTSGENKRQKESSKKLLEGIGVREVGESEYVEVILKQRYTKEAEIYDRKTYLKDLRRFISLLEKEPDKERLFEKYFIFECEDDKCRCPADVFLDQPFLETGLTAYFDAIGDNAKRYALAKKYQDSEISLERLAKFAEDVGTQTKLEIKEVSCRENPEVSYLKWQAPGGLSCYEHDEDYNIKFIECVISSESVPHSKLIWKTVSIYSPTWSEARYCKNRREPYRTKPSQLAAVLTKSKWIPQQEGNSITFVKPIDATRVLLPEGFPFDPGWLWLEKIGFGENEKNKKQEEKRQSEEHSQKLGKAKELGFSDAEELQDAQWFANLPPEQRQEYKLEYERRSGSDLPEREPANSERRTERVGEQAADALERLTEKRTRSVSIGKEDVKEEAGQYLRQQYTNQDDEMICQICKDVLPFKLDDGSEYFEKVEFLKELEKRHYQNYLALCPNHAAMFRHTNGTADMMLEMFKELSGNEFEIVLAQKDITIYFTRTHIADLKTVIETEVAKIQSKNDQCTPSND